LAVVAGSFEQYTALSVRHAWQSMARRWRSRVCAMKNTGDGAHRCRWSVLEPFSLSEEYVEPELREAPAADGHRRELIAIAWAFRQRLLCGLTILQGLQPVGLDHWDSGWLYNPDDGRTYRVSAELRSADVFKARIYLGVPIFGETKTLQRVSRLGLEGWC
jgi:Uncharacterized protein conserved in bacteria (DUF2147)